MKREPDCPMGRILTREEEWERAQQRLERAFSLAIASQVVGDDEDCVGEGFHPAMCNTRLSVLHMARRGEIALDAARWLS